MDSSIKQHTKEWLLSNTDIDHVSFLLTQDVDLLPFMFDFYMEELLHLKFSKKICLTPLGELDAFHFEYLQRTAEKHRLESFRKTA